MLQLTAVVTETKTGFTCTAGLIDTLDTGEMTLLAQHGPITRTAPGGSMTGLEGLLTVLERYSALLEYGAKVDGTLAESLF